MDQQPSKPKKNRRRAIRRHARCSTKVTCRKGSLDLGPDIGIGVLDISETGARVTVNTALAKGETITISFLSIRKRRPVLLEAEVIRCVEMQDGNFVAAVQFRKYLRYADMQEM